MTFPVIHASHARPFIDFLNESGCATAGLLKKAGLPGRLVEPCEAVIVERQLWLLLDIADREQGLADFGLLVGRRFRIEDLGALGQSLKTESTLYGLLQSFCSSVRQESSHARFWIYFSRDKLWFCRGGIDDIDVGRYHAELYTLMLMITLVRSYTGVTWVPDEIHLQAYTAEHLETDDCLGRCRIMPGKSHTAIGIGFDRILDRDAHPLSMSQNHRVEKRPFHDAGLQDTIKAVLPAYLGSPGFPSIREIAEMLGMSVRTLQRLLAGEGCTYSRIADQVRYEAAVRLLKIPDIALTEIAFQLGYSDPAHFSRSFRRWTGRSPRDYRKMSDC